MKEFIIFVYTDSTVIFFSKLRSAGLNYNLPSFFTDPYCAGVSNKHCLLTFFIFSRMNNYLILMLASHEGIVRSVVNRIVQMICLFSQMNFPLIVLLGIHRKEKIWLASYQAPQQCFVSKLHVCQGRSLNLTRLHSSVLCQL